MDHPSALTQGTPIQALEGCCLWKMLWDSRGNGPNSIKSLQRHVDLPAVQIRGNSFPTFTHLYIPSKTCHVVSHLGAFAHQPGRPGVYSSLTNSYSSFETHPRHHLQEGTDYSPKVRRLSCDPMGTPSSTHHTTF